MDELGRGTGVEEGAALCFAISEHILTRAKPFVFFVTHFQELEHLENIYPNVVNYHFQVPVSQFQYKGPIVFFRPIVFFLLSIRISFNFNHS